MSVAEMIPDLWPEEVAVADTLSPLVILKHQAGQLRAKTKGLLEAEVLSSDDGEGAVIHELSVIAPALGRYRVTLCRIRHSRKFVYPVTVLDDPEYGEGTVAMSQRDFQRTLGEVLSHPTTKAVIQSLIARINETRLAQTDEAAA